MRNKSSCIGLSVAVALGVIGAASSASAQHEGLPEGDVQACSLAGVNPSDHPNIFNNPQVARQQYGFVKGADGKWQVIPNCEQTVKK